MVDPPRSSDETPAEQSSWTPAWCLHCGYDLRGLERPHPCPECGHMADPAREREAARGHVTNWKSWFWFLMPSRKIPAGILYLLDDAVSRRIAMRRAFLCWWLPAILGTGLVLIGQQIVVERTMTRHYYRVFDPAKKIVFERHYEEENRPFCLNLHFHGWFQTDPIGHSYEVTYDIKRIRFMNTIDFDPFSLFPIGPIWMVLAGVMIVFMLLEWRSRRSDRMTTFLPIAISIRAASRFFMSSLCMAFWLWMVVLVSALLMVVLPAGDKLEWLVVILIWATGVYAGLVILVAIPRFVMLDKARRLFASSWIGILALWAAFAAGVGSVTLVLWGIFVLYEMLA